MRLIGWTLATSFFAACSSAPPPLLAPGVECHQSAPCASASTETCRDSCNTCGCANGFLSCTIVLCFDTTVDAGR